MKITAIIVALMLTACGYSEPKSKPIPQEVCVGKLEKVTGQHLRMSCEDGQVIEYTSYKYDMTEKSS